MEILLDGNTIANKEILFITLKNQIKSDEFFGNNLDALWEVLSYGTENLLVTILNMKELETNLGDYLNKLLNLFKELNDTNINVTINIE